MSDQRLSGRKQIDDIGRHDHAGASGPQIVDEFEPPLPLKTGKPCGRPEIVAASDTFGMSFR